MQYKTIVLELLRDHPEAHQQLSSRRTLLPTIELYARELKASHEAWAECLRRAMPGRGGIQITSEALEIALWELENSLRAEFSPGESEPAPGEWEPSSPPGHNTPA